MPLNTERKRRKLMDILRQAKSQTFGVEIEMTGIKRGDAAELASLVLGTHAFAETPWNGGMDTWTALDEKKREWIFSKDDSILGEESERVELITPILEFEDLPLLLDVVKTLEVNGAISDGLHRCGIHIHVDGKGHTATSLRNLLNMMKAHEEQLIKAFEVDKYRIKKYCSRVADKIFEQINVNKPKTIEDFADCWYLPYENLGQGRSEHYHQSRYQMLNLHSFFSRYHTIEFRLFQFQQGEGMNTNHLEAMVYFCLLFCQLAKTLKKTSAKPQQEENEAYAFRCWLLRLGFIGEEFKESRKFLLRNFTGDKAWRHIA